MFTRLPLARFIIPLMALGLLFAPGAKAEDRPVRIGVLAYKGPEKCLADWTPSAEYLSANIPGYVFSIVPLDYTGVHESLREQRVEFLLANPLVFVDVEATQKVSRIATMKYLGPQGFYSSFGGVIFCRADRTDIRSLHDLKGKRFAAVDEISFGGWLLAWRDLKAAGVDPYVQFKKLSFAESHDAVPLAVRDGKADAGACRTGTLERLAAEGKIDLKDFYVINEQDKQGYPFVRSTGTYPEWTMAKAEHVADELAEKVALSLLSMPADAPAAKAASYAGWTIPQNYQAVRQVMMDLRLGPYKNLGKVTLAAVIHEYWLALILAAALFSSLGVFSVTLLRLSRRVKAANAQLENEAVERKHAEERFRTMAEFAYHWEMWRDMEGRLIYISPSCKKITGYRPEDFYADSGLLDRIIHHEDSLSVIDHLNDYWAEPDKTPLEFRIVTREGEERWIGHQCRPVFGTDGTLKGRRTTNQDITDLKLAQRRLSEELARTLGEVKALRGLLPACGKCGKRLSDEGYWRQLEGHVSSQTQAEPSPWLCPDCARRGEAGPDEGLGQA